MYDPAMSRSTNPTLLELAPMAAPPRTYGEIFTRRWVVDTILDLVHYAPEDDLGARRIQAQ